MKLSGNTIFITGGGSGIGRGLAEMLHAKGNRVVISGRRVGALREMAEANPGMGFIELDIENPVSIAAAAQLLMEEHPDLNVLINNAGIMKPDHVQGVVDDAVITSTVVTNLLGPIRMTSALVEHLKRQPSAYIINVTSGLGFIPFAACATYSATKAALHSFSLSQRYLLKDTSVKVLELAPPYVQTELMGTHQASDPRAMPLEEFLNETLQVMSTGAHEVLTERVGLLRNAAGPGDEEATTRVNDMFAAQSH